MARLSLAALVSGLLLAVSFPSTGWTVCAWFALVPLLRAIDGERVGRAFGLGWLAGIAFFIVALAWIPQTIVRAGALGPLAAVLPLCALAGSLAVYFALFAAGLRYWQIQTGRDGFVFSVVLWVALEWSRATILLACPWELFGYSQTSNVRLMQMVDVTGIYGVSALLVAVNHTLHGIVVRRGPAARVVLVAAYSAAALLYGEHRLRELRSEVGEKKTLRVALVQPAIDPNEKWDPARRETALDVQESLSRTAVSRGAELVVWPEASAPYLFATDDFYDRNMERFAVDRALRDRSIAFARSLGVPVLIGSPSPIVRSVGRGEAWNSLNRSLLLDAGGRVVAHYDKTILVPFGEYVPFPRALFFVRKIVPGVGEFVPGNGPTLFRVGDARFAVLVCYEAIFPDFARRLVDRGADFLVNQTNDGWFGDSSAPLEHLAMASVRAIENRTPLVRVANTGISAVVARDGRIEAAIPLDERGVRIADVLPRSSTTFYTRHGDLFALGALLAAAAMVVYASWITTGPEPAPVEAA
jgi:apolipoprotein N-acyltransferase